LVDEPVNERARRPLGAGRRAGRPVHVALEALSGRTSSLLLALFCSPSPSYISPSPPLSSQLTIVLCSLLCAPPSSSCHRLSYFLSQSKSSIASFALFSVSVPRVRMTKSLRADSEQVLATAPCSRPSSPHARAFASAEPAPPRQDSCTQSHSPVTLRHRCAQSVPCPDQRAGAS